MLRFLIFLVIILPFIGCSTHNERGLASAEENNLRHQNTCVQESSKTLNDIHSLNPSLYKMTIGSSQVETKPESTSKWVQFIPNHEGYVKAINNTKRKTLTVKTNGQSQRVVCSIQHPDGNKASSPRTNLTVKNFRAQSSSDRANPESYVRILFSNDYRAFCYFYEDLKKVSLANFLQQFQEKYELSCHDLPIDEPHDDDAPLSTN